MNDSTSPPEEWALHPVLAEDQVLILYWWISTAYVTKNILTRHHIKVHEYKLSLSSIKRDTCNNCVFQSTDSSHRCSPMMSVILSVMARDALINVLSLSSYFIFISKNPVIIKKISLSEVWIQR